MEASIPGFGTDSSGSSCGLFALEPPQDMMIYIAFEFADLLPGFPGDISQGGWMPLGILVPGIPFLAEC